MRNLLFIILIIIGVSPLLAQNIVVDGRISNQDTRKREGGVTVTVIVDGKQVAQSTSASNGSYSVSFALPKKFRVEYSKPGFQSKFLDITTDGLLEEDLPIGGKIFPPIDIDLFAERPNANLSFMDSEPVMKWNYDSEKYRMDYDKAQFERMRDRIKDELERAEKDAKAADAKYDQLIKDADVAFSAGTYEDALNKYSEAISLPGKAKEPHPNQRILQIDDILAKQAKEELANKQANQAYFDAIAEADKLKSDKKLDQAEAKYKEAKKLKPDEAYPDQMLLEIQLIRNAEKNREEYEKMIEQADKFFKQNSLQAARDKYKKASQLDPSQAYPTSQLEAIDAKLKEQEELLANKKKYDDAIAAADQLYQQEKYEEAKAKYEEAVGFEPAASYPVERIKMAELKIQEKADAEAKEQQFQAFIKQGNEALNGADYDAAISNFESALGLKKDDANAKKQLEAAKELKAKMAGEEAKKQQVKELLAKADQEIATANFELALETIQAVVKLDPANVDAPVKKKVAEDALKARQQKEQKLAQFEQLKSEADQLFAAENFKDALTKYEAANQLIEEDTHVVTRIQMAKDQLAEKANKQAVNEQIAKLMDAADKSEAKKDYVKAIEQLEEALNLDDSRSDVQEKLSAVIAKKEELEETKGKQAKFEELKKEGDLLFGQKKWEEAQQKYIAANEYGEDPKVDKNLVIIEQELLKLSAESENQANYEAAIEKGKGFESSGELEKALTAFKEALTIRDKDEFATQKMKDIQEQLNAQAKAEANQKAFLKLKEEGDNLFAQKKWKEAKNTYKEALKLNTSEAIELNLGIIEQELAKLTSAAEKEEQYKELIGKAEKAEAKDELRTAIEFYSEARIVKEGDAHATNKVNELESILKGREKKLIQGELYLEAMTKGKKSLDDKDFARAIELFDDALEAQPMDPQAMKLKEEAKKALAELGKNEAAYQKLLSDGQGQLSAGNLLVAKDIYKQAQGLRPSDPLPQNKIVEIDELLRKKQEEEEASKLLAATNKAYQEKMDLADLAASKFQYQEAIDHLKAASKIKPEEQLPIKKINEYQALLDQIAASSSIEQQYKDALRKADQAFDNKNYEESIDLYNNAITIKDDAYPRAQILKAEKAIQDLAANDINRKYQDIIKKAEGHFANENFQQAIVEYKNALGVLPGDAFALGRIAESEQYLASIDAQKAQKEKDQLKFDQAIQAADQFFDDTEFIKAKEQYEIALQIFPTNPYALARMEESIRKAQEKARSGDEAAYRKIVDKADEYFHDENYDKARNLYERATKLRTFDQYPKDQLLEIERILRTPAKEDASLEYLGEEVDISILEGQALFAKADKQKEQDKKQGILKRIFANEKLFEEKVLSDEEERQAYQNEITLIRDRRNELIAVNQREQQQLAVNLDDEMYSMGQQRMQEFNYERAGVLRQNEQIVYMMQDYDQIHDENKYKHLEIADQLDVLIQDQELRNRSITELEREQNLRVNYFITEQLNDFGSIHDENNDKHLLNAERLDELVQEQELRNRSNAELEREQNLRVNDFITEQLNDFGSIHDENSDKHLVNAEKLDEVRRDHEVKERGANALKQEQLLQTDEYLTTVAEDMKADMERATELRKTNEEVVRNIDMNLEGQYAYDLAKNYDKIQEMQRDATMAELMKAESSQEKALIQLQLEEDIRLLMGQQHLKGVEEANQLRENNLQMDQVLVRASEQFQETTASSDEARKETVEVIKSLQAGKDAMMAEANDKKYAEIQSNTSEVESIKIKNEAQQRLMEEDLLAISEEIKSVEQLLERERRVKELDELNSRERTMDALDLAKIETERVHTEKAQIPSENSVGVKALEASLDLGAQAREDEFKQRKLQTNKLLDDITNNKIVITEAIANSLGDDFPEGVTQQTFVDKDKDGYPQKFTTRRIVVVDGRGEVYLRIQTRNAVTYSKNGQPITEAAWYKGTEDSKLIRNN
jgi:tetratricopeptide (TPR) repeat protein